MFLWQAHEEQQRYPLVDINLAVSGPHRQAVTTRGPLDIRDVFLRVTCRVKDLHVVIWTIYARLKICTSLVKTMQVLTNETKAGLSVQRGVKSCG